MPRIPAPAAYLALAILFLASFALDCRNLAGSGSIDLRNRVTGVRLMEAGRDPFRYKWTSAEPPEYCDPFNNLAVPVSKTTVTPTMLLLHHPVAAVSYQSGRYFWLLVQWLFLLATVAAGWRMCGPGRERWLWALAVGAFTYTAAWRLHAERGQSYVVLAAFLVWWVALTRDAQPGRGIWGGLVAGLLVALRPPFLILVPFLMWRRRGQWPGLVVGLGLGVGAPLLLNHSCWHDYGSAMRTWSDLYLGGVNPRPPPQAFPATVEGLPIDVLGHFANIPFADSSFFALMRSWGQAPVPALPPLLVFLVLFAAWHWLVRRKRDGVILLGTCLWAFLADFFLPAYRNTYNDILVFGAVAVALAMGRAVAAEPKGQTASGGRWLPAWIVGLFLIAVALGWWVYGALPRQRGLINLPTLVFVAFAVLGLAWPFLSRQESPAPEEAPNPSRRAQPK